MRRLKILIWHIHGSYLNALARVEHDWYLPVKPDKPEGYGGRGWTFDWPAWVHEVPSDEVRDLPLDLVIYQTPRNLFEDRYEILSPKQRGLPAIYLEHNTPKPDAVHTTHPVLGAGFEQALPLLLVQVTHFNRLMWDTGDLPVKVIEHSVAIDPAAQYRGSLPCGVFIANGVQHRPRISGYDLFLQAREQLPLDAIGLETEEFGGLGDVPYRQLHQHIADYRFVFSPMRYTSLPLAVIEAMTIGAPVVALATTELPNVIQNGVNGYVSCDFEYLIDRMHFLLENPEEAKRLGDNARQTAETRFSIERFSRDWNAAFAQVLALGMSPKVDERPDPVLSERTD